MRLSMCKKFFFSMKSFDYVFLPLFQFMWRSLTQFKNDIKTFETCGIKHAITIFVIIRVLKFMILKML